MSLSTPPSSNDARKAQRLSALTAAGLVVIVLYALARTTLFLLNDYNWYERLITGSLLLSEGFMLVHSLGSFLNVLRVLRAGQGKRVMPEGLAELTHYPPVAIVVSSYKEPLSVVEDNLICFRNLIYPNKHIYFLDDTRYDLPRQDAAAMGQYREAINTLCRDIGVNLFRRKWHGAKAGMINDFLEFSAGRMHEGFEFHHFDGRVRPEGEKYLIVFDADMNPLPDFVEQLVKIMESSPGLAYVQTPQYYTNVETNRVARASGLQQAIFYEYISEGKGLQDCMFCCGTNVMFRREALLSVGGFDETSVTEDFATSLKFQYAGWNSAYVCKVTAFGMGPQELAGYFKQQFRWALGTTGELRKLVVHLVTRPRDLPLYKWWEYFLSCSFYFVGWVFFTLLICPLIYIFFGIPRYFAYPDFFLAIFLPYMVLTMAIFIMTLRQRNYRTSEILIGMVLSSISFPIYMKASVLGVLGYRGSFGITPKAGTTAAPLTALWPQLTAAAACFVAVVWVANDAFYTLSFKPGLVCNAIWCSYQFLILSSLLYFNHADEAPETAENPNGDLRKTHAFKMPSS